MDPELLRLAQQVWDDYASENGFSGALRDLGPRPEVPEEEGPGFRGTASEVVRQAFRGPAVAVTQFGKGLADLLGAEQTSANLRARRAAIEEITGDPETVAGKVAGGASRLAGELGLFLAPGGAVRGAGQALRVAGAAKRAPALTKVGRALRLGGGRPRDLALGAAVDAPIEAGARPEESLADFLGFESLASSPGGRAAVGVGTGVGLTGILDALTRPARSRRAISRQQRTERTVSPEEFQVPGKPGTPDAPRPPSAPVPAPGGAVRTSDLPPELPREREMDVRIDDVAPDEATQARLSEMKAAGLTTPEDRAQALLNREVERLREAGEAVDPERLAMRFQELVGIERGQSTLEGARRGVSEVEAAAPTTSLDDVVALSAEQMTRLKREMVATRRAATDILDNAESLPVGSPEWQAAQEQADRMFSVFDQLAERSITGVSEAGRTLAIHKAQLDILESPLAWMHKAKRGIGRELTTAERNQVRKWFDEGDKDAFVRWAFDNREGIRGNDPRFWAQLWKSAILIPLSIGRATIGNIGRAIVDVPGRPAANVFNKLLGLKTGVDAGLATTPAVLKAWARGMTEGFAEIPTIFKEGISPDDVKKLDLRMGNRLESPIAFTYKGKRYDIVNGLAQVPYQFLAAADRPFSRAAYAGTITEMGEAAAKAEGVDDAATFVRNFVANPPPDAMALATISADVAAMRHETVFGKAALQLKKGIGARVKIAEQILPERAIRLQSRAREAAGELMLPFTTAPGGVTQLGLETAPTTGVLFSISDAVRLLRSTGTDMSPNEIRALQRMAAKRFGRWTTGAAVGMGVGMKLALEGKYSGSLPERGSDREQFFRAEKRPFSFLIGDRWVPGSQAYPFSSAMVFGAEIGAAIGRGENPMTGVVSGTAAQLPLIRGTPFVQGATRAEEATEDPEGFRRFVSRTAGSLVPGAVSRIARIVDPTLREPEAGGEEGLLGTTVGEIQRRIPGRTEELPARLDPFTGEEIQTLTPGQELSETFGLPGLVGAGRSIEGRDPMITEFERLGFAPAAIGKRQNETNEQHRARLQVEGPALASAMRAIVTGQGEQVIGQFTMSGEQQVNLLKQIRDYETLKEMEQTPAIVDFQGQVLGNIVESLKRSIGRMRDLREMVERIRSLQEIRR